jgi:hypothetical protein
MHGVLANIRNAAASLRQLQCVERRLVSCGWWAESGRAKPALGPWPFVQDGGCRVHPVRIAGMLLPQNDGWSTGLWLGRSSSTSFGFNDLASLHLGPIGWFCVNLERVCAKNARSLSRIRWRSTPTYFRRGNLTIMVTISSCSFTGFNDHSHISGMIRVPHLTHFRLSPLDASALRRRILTIIKTAPPVS